MTPFKIKLLLIFLRTLGYVPLPFVHGLGFLLGWLVYFISPKHARLTQENLRLSGVCTDKGRFRRLLRRNIAESGKALLETFAIWFRGDKQQLSLVRECQGWQHIIAALERGKGIIFHPHLGVLKLPHFFMRSNIRLPYSIDRRANPGCCP